jgi:hypothetical protein
VVFLPTFFFIISRIAELVTERREKEAETAFGAGAAGATLAANQRASGAVVAELQQ